MKGKQDETEVFYLKMALRSGDGAAGMAFADDGFVQFPDGGKIWLCGLMADGTIDARLDAIAKEATLAAIANGADPRDVYVDNRL